MLRYGSAPYLECSTKGDRRFNAFNARLNAYKGKSIEEIYQAAKKFSDGSTGLTWRQTKGKKAINQEECNRLYSYLWGIYFIENPELMYFAKTQTGVSDMFGQAGHCCQATEIWRIINNGIDKTKEFKVRVLWFDALRNYTLFSEKLDNILKVKSLINQIVISIKFSDEDHSLAFRYARERKYIIVEDEGEDIDACVLFSNGEEDSEEYVEYNNMKESGIVTRIIMA